MKILICYKFHFIDGFFSDTVEFYDGIDTGFKCRIASYAMKLNFLSDGKKISISCLYLQANTTVQAKFFDEELGLIEKLYTQFAKCKSIYGHSIIQYNNSFYIISDVVCDNYKRCYEPLEEELSPIIIIPTTEKVEYAIEEEKDEEKEKQIEEETGTEIEKIKEKEKNEEIEEEKKSEKEKEDLTERKIEEEMIEKRIKEQTFEEEEKFEEKGKETNEEAQGEIEEEIFKEEKFKELIMRKIITI